MPRTFEIYKKLFELITSDEHLESLYFVFSGNGCGKRNFLKRIELSCKEKKIRPILINGKNFDEAKSFITNPDAFIKKAKNEEMRKYLLFSDIDRFLEGIISLPDINTIREHITSLHNVFTRFLDEKENGKIITTSYRRAGSIQKWFQELKDPITLGYVSELLVFNARQIRLLPWEDDYQNWQSNIKESFKNDEIICSLVGKENIEKWWTCLQEETGIFPSLFLSVISRLKREQSDQTESRLFSFARSVDEIKRVIRDILWKDSNSYYHINKSLERMVRGKTNKYDRKFNRYLENAFKALVDLARNGDSASLINDCSSLVREFLRKEGLIREKSGNHGFEIPGDFIRKYIIEFITEYDKETSEILEKQEVLVELIPDSRKADNQSGKLSVSLHGKKIDIPLKKSSWCIVQLLIGINGEHVGSIFSVDEIKEHMIKKQCMKSTTDGAIISAIKRLKDQIDRKIDSNKIIQNVHGAGYKCPLD